LLRHPFFHGVPWDKLHELDAPNKPLLTSITDTRYFPDDVGEKDSSMDLDPDSGGAINANKDLAFVGFTFKKWETIRKD
jgi:protein-serine/threonine kinase